MNKYINIKAGSGMIDGTPKTNTEKVEYLEGLVMIMKDNSHLQDQLLEEIKNTL